MAVVVIVGMAVIDVSFQWQRLTLNNQYPKCNIQVAGSKAAVLISKAVESCKYSFLFEGLLLIFKCNHVAYRYYKIGEVHTRLFLCRCLSAGNTIC